MTADASKNTLPFICEILQSFGLAREGVASPEALRAAKNNDLQSVRVSFNSEFSSLNSLLTGSELMAGITWADTDPAEQLCRCEQTTSVPDLEGYYTAATGRSGYVCSHEITCLFSPWSVVEMVFYYMGCWGYTRQQFYEMNFEEAHSRLDP